MNQIVVRYSVGVMDRTREQAILREYESVLADAEREVVELRAVIGVLRKRVGDRPVQASTSAGSYMRDISVALANGSNRTTYGGRPNIPTVLKEVLADGAARSIDDIYDRLRRHDAFRDRPPSRGSVSNRLSEMFNNNELLRPSPGVYALPAPFPAPVGHIDVPASVGTIDVPAEVGRIDFGSPPDEVEGRSQE